MKRVALAAGEGIGPEIIDATVRAIDALDAGIEWIRPLVGEPALAQGLPACSDEAKAQFTSADATLFGATSGPSYPVASFLRWGLETFANVRPARWSPGRRSPLARPDGVDFVIVRENLEDAYTGLEGDVADLAPLGFTIARTGDRLDQVEDARYAIKMISLHGSERIARFAFELARERKARGYPGKVTASAKYNSLPQTDGLFVAAARDVAQSYPDIAFETFIVDDLAHRLVATPDRFDIVLLPNLYGDILSDAAAALIGGLGLAAAGCYGKDHAYFESAHGSAPDIAGKGIANPTATILASAMMLEYLGLADPGRRLVAALDRVYAQGQALTPDQGGKCGTEAFTDAVIGMLE
jgi:isocitrate/isopropylmalate dehydrogenase